jgi:hypothetical protein
MRVPARMPLDQRSPRHDGVVGPRTWAVTLDHDEGPAHPIVGHQTILPPHGDLVCIISPRSIGAIGVRYLNR